MKILFSVLAFGIGLQPALALTTQYTSELEPYATAQAVARMSDEDVGLALRFISQPGPEAKKRAFVRALVKSPDGLFFGCGPMQ